MTATAVGVALPGEEACTASPPLVSVIMAVYQDAAYVAEAITSILTQTYSNLEFIIVDDCGADASREIVAAMAERDHRIVMVRNQVNLGLAASLSRAVALASGEYLARMDADDLSMPTRIEKQVAFLEDNPAAAGVSCRLVHFGSRDGIWLVPSSPHAIRARCMSDSAINHPGVMLRASWLARHGVGYRPDLRAAEDVVLWEDMHANGALLYSLPEPLYRYRQHAASITASPSFRVTPAVSQSRIRKWRSAGITLTSDEAALLAKPEVGPWPSGHIVRTLAAMHEKLVASQPDAPAAASQGFALYCYDLYRPRTSVTSKLLALLSLARVSSAMAAYFIAYKLGIQADDG